MDPALTQLLSVGVVWMSFHCVGMCGPIVGGVLGGRATSTGAALRALLLYQAGRASTLALLGALCGAVGATFEAALRHGGSVLTLALAGVLLLGALPARRGGLVALGPRGPWARARAAVDTAVEGFGARLASLTARVDQQLGPRPLVLGMVLSFLPCMIILWGLSLAASTHSAWQGARLMAILVAMTTLPLLVAVLGFAGAKFLPLPAVLRRAAGLLRPLPTLVSGIWLLLVGLAGLGVIPHAHIVVDVAGPRTVMLF